MNFIKRVLIGILLILYTVFSIYLNGPFIYLMVLLFSIIGSLELMRAFKNKLGNFNNYCLYPFIILLTLTAYYKRTDLFLFTMILYMLVEFVKLTFDKNTLERMTYSIFIFIYISASFSLLLLMKDAKIIHFVYLIAWGTDSLAYFFGVTLGRTPLAPTLSPKKTWEGSIGGIFGAVLLSCIYAKYLGLPLLWTGLIAGILSVIAQIGDLSASKLKRVANIKDYGHIFGAHGGVLDRYDSILFIIPFIYLFYSIGGF